MFSIITILYYMWRCMKLIRRLVRADSQPLHPSTGHFTDPYDQGKETLFNMGSGGGGGWPPTETPKSSHDGSGSVTTATPPPSQLWDLGTLPTTAVSPGGRVPPPSSAVCLLPPSVYLPFNGLTDHSNSLIYVGAEAHLAKETHQHFQCRLDMGRMW